LAPAFTASCTCAFAPPSEAYTWYQNEGAKLLRDDVPDLRVGLLGVFAQRKRAVLLDRERVEQGGELEHEAELAAKLRQVLRVERHDVDAVDPDVTLVGA
jgi:hypothetical protein